MVNDETNGSSIRRCLHGRARERARGARHADDRGLGDAEPDLARVPPHDRDDAFERDPGEFFEWVKFRSHLSRGVTVGTMLQDEAFHFLRLGSFLERADNTARLLDVKFHAVQSDFFGAASEQGPGVRLLSLDRDPALGLRLRDLSQGLPRRDPARARRRAADPARRHAALAAACMHEVVANLQRGRQRPVGRHAAPRRPAARRPAVRPHRRDPRHRAARLPDAVPRPRERPGRRHQPRLPGPGGSPDARAGRQSTRCPVGTR